MGRAAGFLLMASLLWPGPPWALAADQCVACHTDEARLRSLVPPPAEIVEEEGSG